MNHKNQKTMTRKIVDETIRRLGALQSVALTEYHKTYQELTPTQKRTCQSMAEELMSI